MRTRMLRTCAAIEQTTASQYVMKEKIKTLYVLYLSSQANTPYTTSRTIFYHPAYVLRAHVRHSLSRAKRSKRHTLVVAVRHGCMICIYARGVYAEPSTIRLNTHESDSSSESGVDSLVLVLTRWCSDVFNRVVSLTKTTQICRVLEIISKLKYLIPLLITQPCA